MLNTSSIDPDWRQEKPDFLDVAHHVLTMHIQRMSLPIECQRLADCLSATHDNGGAEISCFQLPADPILDWYTSRNRWVFDGLADILLAHPTIRSWLQEHLKAQENFESGLEVESQFLFDGRLAQLLFAGGAYNRPEGDGSAEKGQAVEVCRSMFQLRYADVSFAVSYKAWTPWFHGIAWDVTFMLLDKRTRFLWLLAVTDTD